MKTLALMRLKMVIFMCCNGPEVKVVPGIKGLVRMRLGMVISMCCNGLEVKAVLGTKSITLVISILDVITKPVCG
jgi:hypothetical protein